MKNLLNCHCKGLHSFPISFENGLYKRVFYADTDHELHFPFQLAIHPHHTDIKITVLDGLLANQVFEIDHSETRKNGMVFFAFEWNSVILNGKGGFEAVGREWLVNTKTEFIPSGNYTFMEACEMHTVSIKEGRRCVWLIEETVPSCEYFPINYSPYDLTKWTPKGLYQEVDQSIADKFLKPYIHLL